MVSASAAEENLRHQRAFAGPAGIWVPQTSVNDRELLDRNCLLQTKVSIHRMENAP